MGSPRISNSMNPEKQAALLAEERKQNRLDELDRRKWAEEEDAKRIAREQAIADQQKADERAKIAAAQMAEDAAAAEAENQAKIRNSDNVNGVSSQPIDLWGTIYNKKVV